MCNRLRNEGKGNASTSTSGFSRGMMLSTISHSVGFLERTTSPLDMTEGRLSKVQSVQIPWREGMTFTIYPAIDLRDGRCVRLRQGDPSAMTVYAADPVSVARRWVEQGATWLHVVNLDGALDYRPTVGGQDLPVNLRVLAAICEAVPVPVQFGGGVRSLADIELVLGLGAARVVLGTVAVTQPQLVGEAVKRFGADRIVVGLDARDGRVATHGWAHVSERSVEALGQAMHAAGVVRAVYTDIRRDGMLTGVDPQAAARLAETTGLRIIASGGVASLEDIRALVEVAHRGVEGVIVGQALYQQRFTLAEALTLVHHT